MAKARDKDRKVSKKKAKRSTVTAQPGGSSEKAGAKPAAVDRKSLVKKAYQQLDQQLGGKGGGKAIDDLVKLLKLEKDLGAENQQVQEVRARWVPSDKRESSKDR